MNVRLLVAIKERRLTQRQFAALVGDHESVVSRVVNGIWVADAVRRQKYAEALGRKSEELFAKPYGESDDE